jgi:hypothetical protein
MTSLGFAAGVSRGTPRSICSTRAPPCCRVEVHRDGPASEPSLANQGATWCRPWRRSLRRPGPLPNAFAPDQVKRAALDETGGPCPGSGTRVPGGSRGSVPAACVPVDGDEEPTRSPPRWRLPWTGPRIVPLGNWASPRDNTRDRWGGPVRPARGRPAVDSLGPGRVAGSEERTTRPGQGIRFIVVRGAVTDRVRLASENAGPLAVHRHTATRNLLFRCQ